MGARTLTSKGNPSIRARVDPLLYNGLRARALSRNVTLNKLVTAVLGEYVRTTAEELQGTPAILRHLDTLVARLSTQANALALKQISGAVTKEPMKAAKNTQADRLDLHDTVDAILKAVLKLCENEEAAGNAKNRMQAMRLANTTVRTDLALLQGYDRRDIEALIDEVKATNESLKAQLGAAEKGPKRN
jgi:hypothetical protein